MFLNFFNRGFQPQMFLKCSSTSVIVSVGSAVVIFHSCKRTGRANSEKRFIELAATLVCKREILKIY